MARVVQLKTAKEIALPPSQRQRAISWLHRNTFKGKSRWSGLRSYPELSLAGARAKLRDEQARIRAGIDPDAERKQARAAKAVERPKKTTFREVAKDFIAKRESQWSPSIATSSPAPWRPMSIQSLDLDIHCHGTQLVACLGPSPRGAANELKLKGVTQPKG